jgi:diacylglycerol kinase family enzyme
MSTEAAETIGVILNPGSGYVKKRGVKEVCALIQDAVPRARIHVLGPHDDVTRCCQDLLSSGATAVVAAGGDGTVNGVAAALVGRGAALGVLPAGTFNHFAADIGVGHDMDHALQVLLAGQVKTIDVGSVNGKLFLNNSSIGLYPYLVQLRDRVEQGQGKGAATLEAALLMAQQPDRSRVSFTAASQRQTYHGSFLFVGNNRYKPGTLWVPLHRRFRPRLDEGVLWYVILDEPDPGHPQRVPGTAVPPAEAVNGDQLPGADHPEHHGLHALTTPHLTVDLANDDTTLVSTDGEVQALRAPLDYRIVPQALRVIVPSTAP